MEDINHKKIANYYERNIVDVYSHFEDPQTRIVHRMHISSAIVFSLYKYLIISLKMHISTFPG